MLESRHWVRGKDTYLFIFDSLAAVHKPLLPYCHSIRQKKIIFETMETISTLTPLLCNEVCSNGEVLKGDSLNSFPAAQTLPRPPANRCHCFIKVSSMQQTAICVEGTSQRRVMNETKWASEWQRSFVCPSLFCRVAQR